MKTRSFGGASYFLIFVDDRSRYTWVYFVRIKSDVFEYFKEFRTMIEKHTGKCIKVLRSDQGGEYTSGAFKRYLNFMRSNSNLQYLIHLRRIVLLREGTKHLWSVLAVCFKVKTYLMVFG